MQIPDEERLVVERRITNRVFNYWQELCANRRMPREEDIDPDILGDDWPNCFLLQTRDIDHIEQFNFTYLGENILQSYKNAGIDADNLFLVGPNVFALAPRFIHVAQTGKPLMDEGIFFTSRDVKILYRQCLLPLSSKDKRVEAIFGAMLFKTEAK